jgi:hypothetical protein
MLTLTLETLADLKRPFLFLNSFRASLTTLYEMGYTTRRTTTIFYETSNHFSFTPFFQIFPKQASAIESLQNKTP